MDINVGVRVESKQMSEIYVCRGPLLPWTSRSVPHHIALVCVSAIGSTSRVIFVVRMSPVGMLIIFSLFSPQTGRRTRYAVLPLSPFWSHTHTPVWTTTTPGSAHCTRRFRVVLSTPPGTRFMNGAHAQLSVCKLTGRNSGTRGGPDRKSCRINAENTASQPPTRRTIVNGTRWKN